MNKLPMFLSAAACVALLAACSDTPAPVQPKPPTPVSTPFDSLLATEQRARDVQKVVDKAAAQQRQQIDDATR